MQLKYTGELSCLPSANNRTLSVTSVLGITVLGLKINALPFEMLRALHPNLVIRQKHFVLSMGILTSK